jgi:SagB-type dehydrogenase family enzyme
MQKQHPLRKVRNTMDVPVMKVGERFQEETKYFRPSSVAQHPRKETGPPFGNSISLPRPEISLDPGIWETMGRRRSIRDYSQAALTLQELANLLWATQGITLKAPGAWFRTAPSAGALHPIDTYIVVNRVQGLASGIYWLQVEDFTLKLKREGDHSFQISQAALDQDIARTAAVVFVWVAVIQRSRQKYRQRAYRYIYLDSGHIAQNLYLAATAMDLGCCAIAAFFDQEMNQLLGVDGVEETTVYLATVGKRSQGL